MSLPAWNSDPSWNAFTSTYFKDTVDISGNLYVRNGVIASPANSIEFDDYYQFINFPTNVHIFGETKLLYNSVDYNVGYQLEQVASFSGALTTVNSNISTLQNKTTDITYNSSITSIANTLSANNISFSGSINSIPSANFAYLSGATSNLQSQISAISAVSTGTQNNFTVLQRFSNALQLDGSFNVGGASPISIPNNTLKNIQYLSTVSSNVQTQLNASKNKLTRVEYTSIDDTTTITGNVNLSTVEFDLTLNSITPTTFNYLSGVNDYIQDQFNNITYVLTGMDYSPSTFTTFIDNTTSTTTLTFSNTLNGISSTTFGYLEGLTSGIQSQINAINTISLSANNTFTGLNQFNGALGGFAIVENFLQFTTGGASTWKNGSAGDNIFEIAIGGAQRGLTIQGGATSANKSCFGLYFLTNGLSFPSERRPILYALDNGSDASNNLVISTGTTQLTNLNITGNMLTNNGNTTITNDTLNRLQYCTTLSSNVQTQLNNLSSSLATTTTNANDALQRTTDIEFSAVPTPQTYISNKTVLEEVVFSTDLNGITPTTFSYLENCNSNIQSQLNIKNPPVATIISNVVSNLHDLRPEYIYCDGQSLSRTTYSDLFSYIGTTYGSIDGNSFNVPDFRSAFLRGAESRTVNGTTYSPNAVGTIQQDALQSHVHSSGLSGSYLVDSGVSGSNFTVGGLKYATSSFPSFTGGVSTSQRTADETRPLNHSIYYYIRS